MDNPAAHATIDVDAPPAFVYDLIADVTTLPGWAAETDRCQWLDGATGAAIAARFRGRNRHKGRRWSTTCTVTAADPGRRFAFEVRAVGVRTAEWEYEIEPTAAGCHVTESTRRVAVPPALVNGLTGVLLGVPDRDTHNQTNIERTLANLEHHAESRAETRLPPT